MRNLDLKKVGEAVKKLDRAYVSAVNTFGSILTENAVALGEDGLERLSFPSKFHKLLGIGEVGLSISIFILGKIFENRWVARAFLLLSLFGGVAALRNLSCSNIHSNNPPLPHVKVEVVEKNLGAEGKKEGKLTIEGVYSTAVKKVFEKKNLIPAEAIIYTTLEAKERLLDVDLPENKIAIMVADTNGDRIENIHMITVDKNSLRDEENNIIVKRPKNIYEQWKTFINGEEVVVLAVKLYATNLPAGERWIVFSPYEPKLMSGEVAKQGIAYLLYLDNVAREIIQRYDPNMAQYLSIIPPDMAVTIAIMEHMGPEHFRNKKNIEHRISNLLYVFATNPGDVKFVTGSEANAYGLFQITDETWKSLNNKYKILEKYNMYAEENNLPKTDYIMGRFNNFCAALAHLYHHIDGFLYLKNKNRKLPGILPKNFFDLMLALAAIYNGGPNKAVNYFRLYGEGWPSKIYNEYAKEEIREIVRVIKQNETIGYMVKVGTQKKTLKVEGRVDNYPVDSNVIKFNLPHLNINVGYEFFKVGKDKVRIYKVWVDDNVDRENVESYLRRLWSCYDVVITTSRPTERPKILKKGETYYAREFYSQKDEERYLKRYGRRAVSDFSISYVKRGRDGVPIYKVKMKKGMDRRGLEKILKEHFNAYRIIITTGNPREHPEHLKRGRTYYVRVCKNRDQYSSYERTYLKRK